MGNISMNFPLGALKRGKIHLAGGRELTEETGFIAKSVTPLQTFEAMPGLMHMRVHYVLATGLTEGGNRSETRLS